MIRSSELLYDSNKRIISLTHTYYNSGICEGINKASKLAKYNYYLYAHDDFYFCPKWDIVLNNEVNKLLSDKRILK